MRAPVCAIVAAIGLAAHPAFAQTDRTGRLLATRYPEYCGLSVNRERFFPLHVMLCEGCFLVQLPEVESPAAGR